MQHLLRESTIISSAHLYPMIALPTFSKSPLYTEIHTTFYHMKKHSGDSTMLIRLSKLFLEARKYPKQQAGWKELLLGGQQLSLSHKSVISPLLAF